MSNLKIETLLETESFLSEVSEEDAQNLNGGTGDTVAVIGNTVGNIGNNVIAPSVTSYSSYSYSSYSYPYFYGYYWW